MTSSSAFAASFEQELLQLIRAKGGTQQYPYPSHVNPCGIVSIKLSGKNTYNRWQEQIGCLIESHGMQGFIDGRFKNPKDDSGDSQGIEGETMKYDEWKRSDSLVKGWIFGSLGKRVMNSVVGLPTAMDVWEKLKISYDALKGTQQYPYSSYVQPNNFASMKLSGQNNYSQWQKKMSRLVENHGMQGFIDGRFRNPKENNADSRNLEDDTTKYEEWKRSDLLVKGWIFGSLSEDVMGMVVGLPTAMDVWMKLNTTYGSNNKGTQEYPYPSHVQPIVFVSIMLSGQKNYNQWQEQVVCLVETHGMDGFINGTFNNPNKYDDSENMEGETMKLYEEWKRSDSLVKGWIYGSLSENVMDTVVGLPTAMDVWNKLNSSYGSALTTTTTTTDDKETQQYPFPSHVKQIHFVSIKLFGETNYNKWREQIVCLIESHDMQGFINGKFKNPQENSDSEDMERTTTKYEEWKKSDSLVKSWIVDSLSESICSIVVGLPTAMDVWKKIDTTFSTSTPTLSLIDNEGTQQYPYPLHVQKPHGFINLLGQNNYRQWQKQMVRHIENHGMQGFIDGRFENPKENGDSQNNEGDTTKYVEWKRSNLLVKGWIFGSLSEDVMGTVVGLSTAMDVWMKLNTTYDTETKDNIAGTKQYPYPPSLVQPKDFVSIVLNRRENYIQWKEQIDCLIESHGMQGFIDGKFKTPKDSSIGDSQAIEGETLKYEEWKRSDSLVKGWIFGSLSEDINNEVVHSATALDVWNYLINSYSTITNDEEKALAKHTRLQRAIVKGDWETAKQHFNQDHNALTVKLHSAGWSALHFAIYAKVKKQFFENLLKGIDVESLPITVDRFGHTPLHLAAILGNHDAAKMLVVKNPALLFVPNYVKKIPLFLADSQNETFQYLLKASGEHIMISQKERYESPFEGRNGAMLFYALIDERMLDEAYDLIKKYPDIARTKLNAYKSPLSCMAGKSDLYYSGTQYNFYQRFIYTYVPIDNFVGGDIDHFQDIENQESVVISRCWSWSYFNTVIQRLYAKFWEMTLLQVSHIKHLKEDKMKHITALILLKRIAKEVCQMHLYKNMEELVYVATNEAVINNTPEAIKQILKQFPQAYDSAHIDDLFLSELVIINRSEKVHNLLVHDTSTNISMFKDFVDKDGNNLLHLAGRLPLTYKLDVVSGAALQMQRELQWFKEAEKLMNHKQKEAKNVNHDTPIMVFRKEHSELRKEGEQWMKKTADAYTITAALIITIVFAAAITVPGGNNNDGKATYATRSSFTIFAVSDAISLFTSTTSLLLFLSILTARYRDEDFLHSLPKRLILGLLMLFLSVTFLMVAFSATLYLTFGQEKEWILVPIAALTCLPITSFVTLQFPLLVELISSTYGRGIFGKAKRF